jgi:hypothetical protein
MGGKRAAISKPLESAFPDDAVNFFCRLAGYFGQARCTRPPVIATKDIVHIEQDTFNLLDHLDG